MNTNTTYWKSVVFVFLGACSYGVLSTIVKLGYREGFTTAEISGSQMVLGASVLWGLTFLFSGQQKLSTMEWLKLLFAGIFAGLTGVFYYLSLQTIPASIAIILLFQFTWMGVLIESLLSKQWPTRSQILSLFVLAIGTALAGEVWNTRFTSLSITGIGLGLMAGLTYASFVIASGRVVPHVNPWMRSSVMMTGSAIITVTVLPPYFIVNGSLWDGLWMWGILLALFGAILPTLLFTYGVPHIGGGLATILGSAELPTAVFMSSFILREMVNATQWLGVLIILSGIVIAEGRHSMLLQRDRSII